MDGAEVSLMAFNIVYPTCYYYITAILYKHKHKEMENVPFLVLMLS